MILGSSNETYALSLTQYNNQHRTFIYMVTIFFFENATISKFV